MKQFVRFVSRIGNSLEIDIVLNIFGYMIPPVAMLYAYFYTDYVASEYFSFAVPVVALMGGTLFFSYRNPKTLVEYLRNIGAIAVLSYLGLVMTLLFFCLSCEINGELRHLVDFIIGLNYEGLGEYIRTLDPDSNTLPIVFAYYCPTVCVIYFTLKDL